MPLTTPGSREFFVLAFVGFVNAAIFTFYSHYFIAASNFVVALWAGWNWLRARKKNPAQPKPADPD